MLTRIIKVLSVSVVILGSPVWLISFTIFYIFTGIGPLAVTSAYLHWLNA